MTKIFANRRVRGGSALLLISLALISAIVISLAGSNARAAFVSSNSSQCQVDVSTTSGVNLSLSNGTCFLQFTATGSNTWTVPAGVKSFNFLIIGGGGGGGPDGGSGGGSGSLYEGTVNLNGAVSPTFSLSVGAGGTRGMHTAPSGQTLTSASAGGNTTFTSSALSFSATAYGGGPGDWPDWTTQKAGGYAGGTPAVSAGSTSVTLSQSTAGRQGANAPRADTIASGISGSAGVTSALFGGQFIGSGGSGAIIGWAVTPGGSGGAGGGGRGGGGEYNNATTFSMPGTANTGGGGGGGSRNAPVGEITLDGRSDHSRNGSAGGSGLISISYTAPKLATTRAADGARLGQPFLIQPQIQLVDSSNANASISGVVVTATSASGTLANNTATTNASGRADFSNLQFSTGSLGSIVITFSAPGYVSVTQTVKLQTLSTDITISSSSSSNGNFVDGVWLADSAAASVINNSALQLELQARNVTIEASSPSSTGNGNISVQSAVSQALAEDRTLTLKSGRGIYIDSGSGFSATNKKLNIVLWADADGANSGAIGLPGSSTRWSLETNGGHVAIGGGNTSTSWNGLTVPAGYAAGESQLAGMWWGVELGTNQSSTNRKLISTNGGNLRIYGEAKASTASHLYGIAWEGGEISTGSGAVELNGKTTGSPTTASNPNYGVGIGANYSSAVDVPILNASGTVGITGTTSVTTSDHMGVYVRGATLNAGSSVITMSSDRQLKILSGNTFSSRVNVTSSSHIYVEGTNSFTGNNAGKAVTLTSSSGWVNLTGAATSSADMDISCPSGGFSNSSSGTLTVTGALSVQCDEISVGGAISTSGATSLVSLGAAKNVTVNSNITTTSAGGDILLKSKANVLVDTAGVTLQTAGASSGTGGRIIIWSDSDASGQGYISIDPNSTLNTIGGAASTYTGGGDIHLAGGLDNGSTAISASAVSGDGLPDGWAISTGGTMGIWYGYDAVVGNVNTIQSGGGDIRMFGKSTTTSDAFAFNWTTRMDSGEGQIELRADSGGWGLQLNRGGGADTYNPKSVFTSRSNTHPAIIMHAKSSGDANYVGLLGSWADSGTDNLLIQAVGDGGITLSADAPTAYPALGLTSTAVLSKSGKITIDGGTSTTTGNGAIHFGMLRSDHSQGSVQLGDCAVATCANSLVTSSTADIDIIANRVATLSSLSTSVSSTGKLSILPATNSTAFTDFQGRTAGLSLASKLGGLQIGRRDDTTATMNLQNNWSISGPISVHASDITVKANLTTTGSSAPITLRALTTIYIEDSKVIQTNGSDVVLWASAKDSTSGKVYFYNSVCINTNASCDASVATSTGNIYIGGGSVGTNFPSGPVVNSSDRAVRFGHTGSGIKLLSGGGDISVQGQAPIYGIEAWAGITIKATTGAISLKGTSSSAGYQAVRIAGSTGDSTITSAKTSGTAIEILGTYTTSSGSYGVVIADDDSFISATGGGDVVIRSEAVGSNINPITYLYYANLSAAAGGRVQIRSAGNVDLYDTDITTTGQTNNAGGEISIWADSDANNVGRIYVSAPSCISTATNCASTPNTGGSKIVLGGGPEDSSDTFFPAQGAVSNSGNQIGIWLGANHAATGVRIISGGGDIRIASEFNGALSNYHYGQLWYGGTVIHSGNGAIEAVNTAAGSATSEWNVGVYLHQASHPITVTSNKSSGTAISVTSATNSTGNYASPFVSWSSTAGVPVTLQAPNGGDIVMSGTSTGTGAQSVSFDLSQTNILASTGDISLSGNRGFRLNAEGSGGPLNFGAIAAGSAEGDISLLGNRFTENPGHAINFKTSGKVTIAPLDGASYLEATTFPASLVSFTGVTELAFGNTTNTQAHTTTNSISGVVGPVTFRTGNYTGTGSITNTVGPVRIYSSGTTALNSNITSGSGGILVQSTGRITTSAGTSGAAPRLFGTAGGPITFWTTGAAGGVTFNNFTQLTTTQSSAAGADITIGGGVASSDPLLPSSSASSNADHGVTLGTAANADVFVVRAGTGNFKVFGQYTGTSSTAKSGIYLPPGQSIIANKVDIEGRTTYSAADDSASGIDGFFSTARASLIESTGSFGSHEVGLRIAAQSASLSGMTLGPSVATTDQLKLRTSGNNGDIEIVGSSTNANSGTVGVFMAAVKLETKNGDVKVDAGSKLLGLTRSTRIASYQPVSGGTGGDITLTATGLDFFSGAFNVSTAGVLSFVPKGTSFAAAQTFPTTSSVTNVGGLVVGSATNTQALTVGAAVTSSGDVKYLGGAQTQSFAVTTTNNADVIFNPTTTFTGSAAGITAAGDVEISGGTSTITTGAGAVSASNVTLSSGGNITISGNITATNSISTLATGTATTSVNANLSAGSGGILLKSAGRITTSAGTSGSARTLSTASGPLTLWTTTNSGGVTLNNWTLLQTNASGAGADITIGGGSADGNNPLKPGGNATTASGDALVLATSNAENVVRIFAGTGHISLKAESTEANASSSGIELVAGVKVIGGTVDIYGKAALTSGANNTGAGVFNYHDLASAQTVIEATKSFSSHTQALAIKGEVVSGGYPLMLGNETGLRSQQTRLSTIGDFADIYVEGNKPTTGGWGLFMVGTLLSTKNGDTTINANDHGPVLSRSTSTRKFEYAPITGEPGGDLTIRADFLNADSTGTMSVTTAGKLSFVPRAGQGFTSEVTFPLAGSSIDVGGMVVGSAENTQDLTLGSAVTSSGDVEFLGGAQTANFAITTSNSANIEFYPTTSFSKSTNLFNASGSILIGTSSDPASTATLSSSTLTAGTDVKVYATGNLTLGAAVDAGQDAVLESAGAVTLNATVTADRDALVSAASGVTQASAVTAGNKVSIVSAGSSSDIAINAGLSAGAGGIVLKSARDVVVSSTAKNITTSGDGDIVIWGNSSGAGGEVETGGTAVVIDSNGGDIVIAGGADDGANGGTASDGIPDNYLLGRNTANSTARLRAAMSSDAGDILVRAQHFSGAGSSARAALYAGASSSIRATTGNITLEGIQNSGNTSASNQYGVWLGESTSWASRAVVKSDSGDISIVGDASQSNALNRRGVVFYSAEVAGRDISIFGKSPNQTGAYDVIGWSASTVTATRDLEVSGAGTSGLELTTWSAPGLITFKVGRLLGGELGGDTSSVTSVDMSIAGTGQLVIEPFATSFTADQRLDNVTTASTLTGFRFGKTGNLQTIRTSGTRSFAGNVELIGSLVDVQGGSITSTTNDISITADNINLDGALTASSGKVVIGPQTSNRTVTLGTEVANTVSLRTTEISRITTPLLRISTAGNIDVTASQNFTGKVSTLALRAGGDVTGSAGVAITVVNLGIDAGGTVNFPGNQSATLVALSGSAVTYNQTVGTFTPSTVDGIAPVYGIATKLVLSQVPTSSPVDAFMNTAFNPPPAVTLQDTYSNNLTANNSLSSSYTITATLASGPGSLAGTTSKTSAASGSTTFSDLNISTKAGAHTITFTATDTATSQNISNTPSATTGDYNVKVTVTLNADYGSVSPITQSFDANQATNLVANTFTRDGYDFAGWSTTSLGSLAYDDQDPVTLDEDLQLFALWTATRTFETTVAAGVLTSSTPAAALRQPVVQMVNDDGSNYEPGATAISVTATVSGCGTDSQTVTASSTGAATFTDLEFVQSTLAATCTITYSAPDFNHFVETVTVKGIPTSLEVSNGTLDATGEWIAGTWYSGISTKSILTPAVLQAQLALGGTSRLLTSGTMSLIAAVTDTTAGSNLTLESTAGTIQVREALSLAGNLTSSSSSEFYSTAAITSSGGAIAITSSANAIRPQGAITASQGITLQAHIFITASSAGAISSSNGSFSATTTTGTIQLDGAVSANNITISPKLAYSGNGFLTATAGDITISGGTSVSTYILQASEDVELSGTGNITVSGIALTAANPTANSIAINSSSGSVTMGAGIKANQSVTIVHATSFTGSGNIESVNGDVSISGGQSLDFDGAITAKNNITLSTAGLIDFSNPITSKAAGLISISSVSGDITVGNHVLAEVGSIEIETSGRIQLANSDTIKTLADGDISLSADRITLNANSDVVSDQDINIETNSLVFNQSTGKYKAPNGAISVSSLAPTTSISLGGLVDQNRVTVPAVRVESPTLRLNSQLGVSVGDYIDLRGRVTTLAVRTQGSFSASGRYLGVPNLGVDADGPVSLPIGGQGIDNLSLSGSAVTVTNTSGVKYTVAAVDGIQPEYGVGVKLQVRNVPTSTSSMVFQDVVFATKPQAFIIDKFNNELTTDNLSLADYSVTASLNVLTTTSGTPTLASATPTRPSQAFLFNDLKVTGGTGTGTITFTGSKSGTPFTSNSEFKTGTTITAQSTPEFTTGTYEIMAGEPASISLSFAATSAQAGKTGLAPVATLKDSVGNTISSGTHSTATVSLAISGADGTIVSGDSVSTVEGVASFPNLILGGKVNTNYTLTFSVTFTDTSSVSRTRTATQVITLTPGDAAQLSIDSAAQSVANRTTVGNIEVSVRDAYGNVVPGSTAPISLAFADGTNTSETPVVTGNASPVSAVAGVATFSGIVIASKVDDYTITATSSNLVSDTQDISLTHGEAYSVVLTSPTTVTNNVVFGTQPSVEILDQDGNRVTTGSQAAQEVTISSTASLSGTVSMHANGGVANFNGKGLKLTDTIGNYTITASVSSPSSISDTNNITIAFGSATKVAITTDAAGFVNRTNFTTQPVVTVQDISGNTVEDFAGDIELSIAPPAGQTRTATITGTTTLSLTASDLGVATFSGLGLQGTIGDYTITASSSNLTSDTQDITLTHGAAHALSVFQSVAGVRAGIEFTTQPKIETLDQDGNRVTTGDGAALNIRALVGGSGSTIGGTLSATSSSGLATFSNLKLSGTARSYDLTFEVLSPAQFTSVADATQTVTLLAGDPSKLVVLQQPAAIIAGEDFASDVKVQIQDAWDNPVLSDSSSTVKPVLVETDGTTVIDNSKTAVQASSGDVTFQNLTFTSAGSRKILFELGAIAVLSDAFQITHAAASQIVWNSSQPSGIRNDIAISPAPSFEIQDQFGNPAITGPRFTVTASVVGSNSGDVIALTGTQVIQAASASTLTFSNLVVKAPEASYKLRFTAVNGATEFFVESGSIPLTYGLPSQLAITRNAVNGRSGVAFGTQPKVEVRDTAGNLVADSSLAITASVSGRTLVGSDTATAINGVATFSGLGVNGAAATGLTLEFETEYPSGTPITTSQQFDLTAGLASIVAITQQPTTLVTRETFSPAITVDLWDQAANVVTSDSSSVVQVRLFNNQGQLATATNGQPALADISATALNGEVTFTGLGYAVAPGVGYYLQFELNGYTVNSSTFTVLPGVATSIAIDTQPSTTISGGLVKTGELLSVQPRVSLFDQDGYLATTTTGTVTAAATNGGDLSEGATTATISNGTAQFAGVKLVGTPEQNGVAAADHKITFTFGSATIDSQSLNVTHNDAHSLYLVRGAANGRADEVFTQQPIVEIRDRYGNRVETGNGSVLDIRVGTSGGSVGGANVQAVAGRANFSTLRLGGYVNTDYTLTFEAADDQNITTATQSGVQVSYGFAAKLRITQEPVSLANSVLTKTGDALATQPVIEVVDNWNNRVENSSAIVTAALVSTTDVRDRLENVTAQASQGLATFSNLKMIVRPLQDYRLKFTSGSLTFAQSAAIQVSHANPTQLEIVTQPSSSIQGGGVTKTGDVLATTPVVRALDFDGNVATSLNGDLVTASVTTGGGTADTAMHGNGLQHNQATFVNGVATLSNLRVVALPGVTQKLTFSGSITNPSSSIGSVESDGFALTFADAHQLAVLTQPCAAALVNSSCVSGVTGDALAQQPVVEIQDRFGNRVTDYVGSVSVSTTSAGSTILVGGVVDVPAQTATVVSGLASFSGLGVIATPGAQTVLSFSSGSLLSTSANGFTVDAAAPYKLRVATQPTGARTGDDLATMPIIEVLDRFDNIVLSDSSTIVSVAVATGTNGVLAPAGNLTTSALNGVATFTGVRFSGTPDADYRLGFSANGLIGATSSIFSVDNGLAAGFEYVDQPAADKTGDVLTQIPKLKLLDAEGNLAADDSTTTVAVSFAVTDGNAYFADSSDQPISPVVTAVNGVVTFGDLRVVGTPGFAYKLRFTATPQSGPSYVSSNSDAITLRAANPFALVVTQGPVGGLVAGALSTQPVLQVKDRFSNNVTWDNQTAVTATIFNDVTGSLLSGASASAVNGVVSFSGITPTGTPGAVYKLRFSAVSGAANFSVDEQVGFTLSKTADVTFSYQAVSYSPNQIVTPTFITDSPATPVFTTSSTSSVCELVLDGQTNLPNGQIRVIGVGDCVVSVTIPNAPYYFANSANATLAISRAQQAPLVISSANNVDFWSTMTPAATGGSGTGTLSFLVQGDCRIIGTTLIPGQAGSACELTARKLGDANYVVQYSEPMNITINKIAQTPLRMASANTANMSDVNLFTAGGSGDGAITYSITTNRTVAGVEQCVIVDGNKLRALSSGVCGVSATKATSTNYLVAISPQQSVTFTKAEQRVNFTSSVPSLPMPGQTFTPVAVASSNLPVTYSITTGLGTICAWDTDPTKVKFLAAGNCEITATQAGSAQFVQASATQLIVVAARNQTISFAPIPNRTYGEPSFFLSATASSGLPVSYSLGNSVLSPGCTVTNTGLVTLVSAGACEIVASQAGNQEYLAAVSVSHIFEIAPDLAGAPHLVSISAGKQTLTVSFNPPSYRGGANITAYRMVAVNGDGDEYINPGCTSGTAPITCSLVGVPADVTYTIKVAAITVAGIGLYSESSLPITTSNGEMSVINLIASPSAGLLTLNWESPLALDSSFDKFDVYVWPLGEEAPETPTTSITSASATSAEFSTVAPIQAQSLRSIRSSVFSALSAPTSVAPAPAYQFKVVTITDQTQSAGVENTSVGMQQSFTTPAAPTQLQLSELGDKLVLGWSAPLFDGGKSILDYQVNVNGELECDLNTSRMCEYEEPRPGETYEFTVAARNELGLGAVATYSITIPAPVSTSNNYDGPQITLLTPNPAKPGTWVTATGVKLDTVSSIEIAGREMSFNATATALRFLLPANLADGTYDLVLQSSYGRLTIQQALTVSMAAVDPEIEDEETDGSSESGSSGSGSTESGSSGSDSSGSGSDNSGSTESGSSGSEGNTDDSGSNSGEGSNGSGDSSDPDSEVTDSGSDGGANGSGELNLIWILLSTAVLALIVGARRRFLVKASKSEKLI